MRIEALMGMYSAGLEVSLDCFTFESLDAYSLEPKSEKHSDA